MSDNAPTPTPPPQGSASYIRTYAKDLAAQGGAPSDAAHVSVAPPAPKPTTPASVPAPKPTAAEPAAPVAAVPPPPTVEPEPAYIIPNAPSTMESRESVLARLRAKAPVAAPLPTAAPTAPTPNAPSTNESRQSILDRLHAKAGGTPVVTPAPAAEISMPTLPASDAPSPLHTYKTDFADKTKTSGASTIAVLAAEQDAKGTAAPAVITSKRSMFPMVAGGIALILLGCGSIFLALWFIQGKPPTVAHLFVPSIIFADSETRIEGSGPDLQRALVNVRDDATQEGEVVLAYITYATTTKDGTVEMAANGGDLFKALELAVPQIVARNTTDAAVGVVRALEETRPFFVLRVSSYERTYAGMLSWEKTLANDLGYFYPAYESTMSLPVGTSTASTPQATTTPPKAPYVPRFRDMVIDNYDVRILRDADGRSLMLYGYRDKETLIIARNETAFKELAARLASARSE